MINYFNEEDADKNFKRQIDRRKDPSPDYHPVIQAINEYPIKYKNILEVGAGNGCTLTKIQTLTKAKCVGIDPGEEAIKYGKEKFKNINLIKSNSDNLLNLFKPQTFDLIIFGSVLFHINPEKILKTLGFADELLVDEGFLLIWDLYSKQPHKTIYKHSKDVFCWKFDQQSILDNLPHFHRIYFKTLWYKDDKYAKEELFDLKTAHYISIHKKSRELSFPLGEDPSIIKNS
tara:strand:- start:13897 stop:14589 length:693 start_codon:yes stop_codon:yes gene_type:complete